MRQSRRMSLLEAVANVAVGYGLALWLLLRLQSQEPRANHQPPASV